ncbi:FxSxx-COOH system tetratricopeptide repeat protein [Dactylosporangium sp. NPDC051484]|uniref:FxSxx-COOH system tetratricopeptide repeat protein n=1 Tax=Dactylosporangium sp. NPDC051484 TaxID=3154942 RepID=UPI0034507307
MPKLREGRIVTFYSFAGGSGCTMALANVAWILAANGRRVLAVDWDLESPGLHKYFDHFLERPGQPWPEETGGVSDLIRRFERAGTYEPPRPLRLSWEHFPPGGGIDYLPAGRHDPAFTPSLGAMDWDAFYAKGGGLFFDALRRHMTTNYDLTLVDSPSGLGDLALVCVSHLPDVVLNCFTLSGKSIDGAAQARRTMRGTDRPERILPVPMRVDPAQRERAEAGLRTARKRMPDLPTGMSERERDAYWRAVEVPYHHAYAYEETMAVLTEQPGRRGSVLAAYERLAWHLGGPGVRGLPPVDDGVRHRTAEVFQRRPGGPEGRLVVHYEPADQAWADWVIATLAAAGLHVQDAGERATPAPSPEAGRELRIISAGRAAAEAARQPVDAASARPPLGVYVDDVPAVAAFPEPPAVRLRGLAEGDAVDRLLHLAGGTAGTRPPAGLRYPGAPPVVRRVPDRTAGFTGREAQLRALRRRLLRAGQAGPHHVTPVVLHGIGGVGKTALAVEYLHRYAGAYDLVWWVDCDRAEAGVADLARALGVAPAGEAGASAAALSALRLGAPHRRWLVVFDGAESYRQVRTLLPQGAGHVVITSRNRSWDGRFARMEVGAFDPNDSVLYLGRHMPGLDPAGAAGIARALGDLPLALSAAAEQLRVSGESAAQYLRRIEDGGLGMPAVEAVWEHSLTRLEGESPVAYRLLQLFSVLHSDTATHVVYSDAMAEVLKPYEKLVADRLTLASLVQQISRLGLLEPDLGVERIHMHPLLQRVVRERTPAPQQPQVRHQAHVVLAGLAKGRDVDERQDWPQLDLIWPHLAVSRAAACREEAVRELVLDRIRRLLHEGALAQAAELAGRTEAEWSQDRLGDPGGADWQLLHLRGLRATVLREQGRFAEALRTDEEVARAQAGLLGPEHPNTLVTLDRLVADLRGLGRYTEAMQLALRAYRSWSRAVGRDHARTLDALTGLATAYRAAGRYRAARRCDERVARRRPFPGPDRHPAVLRTAAGLGRDLRDAREYTASVTLLRAVAEACEETLGPGAPATVAARANLAVSLHAAGRPQEAAALLGDAWLRMAGFAGQAGPDALACRHSWGLSLLATDRAERARAELEQVLQLYRSGLGRGHPLALIAEVNLAVAAAATGDRANLALARESAATAAAALATVLPAGHPHAQAAAANAAALGDGPPGAAPQTIDPY